MLEAETGEITTRRLEHENGEAKAFYARLPKPSLIGIEKSIVFTGGRDAMKKMSSLVGVGIVALGFVTLALLLIALIASGATFAYSDSPPRGHRGPCVER